MSVQKLAVNLSIPIPSDSILIKKVELEKLKRQELSGVYWNMRDLEQRTNRSADWLKKHVLYNPRFREKLDAECGGFVYYPKTRGETWAFQASRMAEFLDHNFQNIFAKRR